MEVRTLVRCLNTLEALLMLVLLLLPRVGRYFLLGFISIILLPSEIRSAAWIDEPRQICGGVIGRPCPEGYFCAYPRPSYPDAQGICREKTSKALIEYGDVFGMSGDAQTAIGYYSQAYTMAAETGDPYAMVALADRYLRLRYEQPAMDSYAKAISFASRSINEDPGRGQRYAFGMKALQDAVSYYNSTIQMLPASPATREWFKSQVLEANNLLASQTSPPLQPPPQRQPQPGMPTPVPDPSGMPPGIFCPPETVWLGGNCVPILPFPGLPPAK